MSDDGNFTDEPQDEIWAALAAEVKPKPYQPDPRFEAAIAAVERWRHHVPPANRGGRPPGRLVSLGRIARAYVELTLASDKRPSQADVAVHLNEDLRNVERTIGDNPGFWDDLTRPT